MSDSGSTFISRRLSKHLQMCWMLYLSGFLDLCGGSMLCCLIPGRIRDTGASTTLTGSIGSVYGGIQLLSSPVIGKWADGVSKKTSLLTSLMITAVGYGTLILSPSIFAIIASRIILGFFKHSQTMSKAYLAHALPEKERPAAIGRFNSFSSLGIIVGPIIGGILAESLGFTFVASTTTSVVVLNSTLVWLFVPHSNPLKSSSLDEGRGEHEVKNGELSKENSPDGKLKTNSSQDNSGSLLLLKFWDLFVILLCGSFSVILYRSNSSLMLKEKYFASPKTIGYITSYTGFVSMVCGGLGTRTITDWYKNDLTKLYRHLTACQVIVFLGLGFASSIPILLVFMTGLSMITSLTRVTSSSIIVDRCGKDNVAAVMGWSQSVTSVSRMMAPFVAGVAQEWSMVAACFISVIGASINFILMTVFPHGRKKDIHKKQD